MTHQASLLQSKTERVVGAKPAQDLAAHRAVPIDVCAEGELLLASGAAWRGDGDGNWILLEAEACELETAVLELLARFGFPVVFVVEQFVEEDTVLPRLLALLQSRSALPIEDLKRAAETKYGNRYPFCGAVAHQRGCRAINPNCDERGQCADCVGRIFKMLANGAPQLHAGDGITR